VLQGASFTAEVGKQIDEKALREFLVRMGFNQAPTVMEPGDYASRGGLIDLYPPGNSGPVRLDLFGDVLDAARRFDPETQRTIEKLTQIELAPVSEVILDEAAIQRFRQNYRHEFGAAGTDDPLYEAVSAGRKHQGIEHWAPFFHEHMETLLDYLPGAIVCLDDQTTAVRLERWDSIVDQYEARTEALTNKSRLDSVYKPCPPGLLYLDDTAFEAALAGFETRQFIALPQGLGPNVIDAGGRIGRNFAPERQVENVSLFGALADHVNARRAESQVVVASYSEGARERLSHLMRDEGVGGATSIGHFDDIPDGTGGLFLAVWGLEQGFQAPGLTVICELDVLGDRVISTPKR
jgi:transcription-repair coupling factor (superfamily II helicase)